VLGVHDRHQGQCTSLNYEFIAYLFILTLLATKKDYSQKL